MNDGQPVTVSVMDDPAPHPGVQFVTNRPRDWSWKIRLAVVLVCFTCGFFTQYQAVAPCLFAFHALYLSFIYMEHSIWRAWTGSILISFGLAFSMSQVFRPGDVDGWDWTSAGISLAIQVLLVHVFFAFGLIHTRLSRISSRNIVVLCYPTLVACGYAIAAMFTPLASQASMAYALSEWLSFVQIVSLFGLSGVNLAVLITSTCLCHYILIDTKGGTDIRRRRFACILGCSVFFITWLFGSFRLAAPLIYQRGVNELAVPSSRYVSAACITRSGDDGTETMLRLTNETLQDKDVRFVIWSEAAGGTFYDDSESLAWSWQTPVLSSLLRSASSVAAANNATIGVTYMVWARPNDYTNNEVFNILSFVNPNGEWIANYTKRYPVPVIEGDVVASSQDVAHIEASPIGPFNAAICYDLDHPEFIRRGSNTGLLLQSANTWGVVGHYHAISSSFRAIENGVHLLRCGSQGPSGLWDPYGQEYLYDVRKDTGVVLFQLPYGPSRIWTFYTHAGFVIDYILFAAAGLFILLFAMSFKRSLKHRF